MTVAISHRRIGLALALAISVALLPACKDVNGATKEPDKVADATAADAKTAEEKKEEKKKEDELRIPVEVQTVAREAITASFQGTATLEPEAEAQVVTKTAGVILDIRVEEGDHVEKGQILARLDNDRQRLAVQQAKVNLDKLDRDFARLKELQAKKLVAVDAFEKVRSDVEMQRAAVDIANLELSYTEIRAPISGVVSQRLVKLGNLVQLHQALFKIDDFEPLLAMINVPEREMSTIKAGQPIQMLVDAVPGQPFAGLVARVSPVVDAKTGTVKVTAEFHDERLKSGMFGRIAIVYDTRPNALVIPRQALVSEEDAAVFVLDGDVAKRVPVTLGFIADGRAEIVSGLKDDAQVITLGQAAIRDGSKVTVVKR